MDTIRVFFYKIRVLFSIFKNGQKRRPPSLLSCAPEMGVINLKKTGSFLLYLNISGLDSHFMFDGSSTTIRYLKTTENFYVFFTKTKLKNNCLSFLVNRIITELLLQCIEWLRNTFLHLLQRKKLSRSVGKMRSYQKIFPRLTKISLSCRWDLG